jgi:hypothetical protein
MMGVTPRKAVMYTSIRKWGFGDEEHAHGAMYQYVPLTTQLSAMFFHEAEGSWLLLL